jgi:hypothetical protein
MKALIVNRIGDFGLSLGIFAIFFVFGAVDYSTVFSTVTDLVNTTSKLIFFNMEFDILTVICFFLFIGAVGKSAQIGLHTWLPDAMEGFLSRALLKLHYMREHPSIYSKLSWSTQSLDAFVTYLGNNHNPHMNATHMDQLLEEKYSNIPPQDLSVLLYLGTFNIPPYPIFTDRYCGGM